MEFRDRFCITPHEAHQNSFSSSSIQFSDAFSSFLVPQSSSWPATQPFSWQNIDNSSVKKEHMFDKIVTPSDVGKLNRLVIPKQHAEKHFPFDTAANEKGLILCFEDRTGKSWRFRYSYWNSSQSYVMTKGWSRFVKEKRLNAGDTVSFGRGLGDATARGRLFIDWHRHPEKLPHPVSNLHMTRVPLPPVGWSVGDRHFFPPLVSSDISCKYAHNESNLSSMANQTKGQQLICFRTSATSPPVMEEGTVILDSVPVMRKKSSAKRIRLFGVNLCAESKGLCSVTDDNCRSSLELCPPAMELMASGSGGDTSEASSWTTTMSSSNRPNLSFDLAL